MRASQIQSDSFYTSGEIAEITGLTRNTVKKYCHHYKMQGNRRLYQMVDVVADLARAKLRYSKNMTQAMHRIRRGGR